MFVLYVFESFVYFLIIGAGLEQGCKCIQIVNFRTIVEVCS